MNQMRILATHDKRNHPQWFQRVEFLPGWQDDVDRNMLTQRILGSSPLSRDLKWAWRFFLASKHYDVLLTGSERLALIVALLQRFVRRQSRVPHVLMECMWKLPQGRLARWKRRLLLRWVASATDRIVVYARHQVGAYADAFGIPKDKFVFIPSHSTLFGRAYPATAGDYVFSGGYTNRDYATLFEAVRGLPYRVIVCVGSRSRVGSTIPANVEVFENLCEDAFNSLMAGSAFVVVPLKDGLLEAGGRQVFQNAMTMGKAVIVTDTSATDYIKDGVTGLLIPSGNPKQLRESIIALASDPIFALQLGNAAQNSSADFSPERFFDRVFCVVDEAVQQRHPTTCRDKLRSGIHKNVNQNARDQNWRYKRSDRTDNPAGAAAPCAARRRLAGRSRSSQPRDRAGQDGDSGASTRP